VWLAVACWIWAFGGGAIAGSGYHITGANAWLAGVMVVGFPLLAAVAGVLVWRGHPVSGAVAVFLSVSTPTWLFAEISVIPLIICVVRIVKRRSLAPVGHSAADRPLATMPDGP
jgi:hypothetical protein